MRGFQKPRRFDSPDLLVSVPVTDGMTDGMTEQAYRTDSQGKVSGLSAELYTALRTRSTVPPLAVRDPALTIDDAYRISLGILEQRLADGEALIGKKIGVTSTAVQEMLGVHQPDFGFLTDAMLIDGEIDIAGNRLIHPRAEAEIAFFLKRELIGPGITPEDVLDATDSVAPCFEIVDSRIEDWKIAIVDTVADNASCGVFVLGEERVDPRTLDLPALHCTVSKNGAVISEGYGSAVQGSPLAAVAWLANTLGAYGVRLNAGDVILSGSLVPLAPAVAGDRFEMQIPGLGTCTVQFR
jgi:2-oxopent-4-enoate/cis-2-oxohex-4-enoate hydratase